ncbi:GTP pyrophosphokinase [mine drainage metagenome]|jgi:GTP pyrophosphokinase|uniref:GTP pyrophosphokinase n=1 Tax=mine drainage metagenome TaxID=410659 RepID=A0A1J5QH71_9ZZZZ
MSEAPPTTAPDGADDDALLDKARAFSAALLDGVVLDTGESALQHAAGTCAILHTIGADRATRACAYLSQAAGQLAKPDEQLTKAFGPELARLARENLGLVELLRSARRGSGAQHGHQELMRRLLLAFSSDLRVVLLRLASRLQSLRHFAASGAAPDVELTQESLQVYAPLANRLGLWQIKWEIEDLAFRWAEPQAWAQITEWLAQRASQREALIAQASAQLQAALQGHGIAARISGRSKHAYSIWRKMQGKSLRLEDVMDLLAMRVIVERVEQCYATLSVVHELWTPLDAEYDDYIARPKPNGYQSLHTVVRGPRELPIEIQIRTEAMHAHAEQGVAAHWAYKEAGTQGYKGVSAGSRYDAQIALARQLLALRRELAEQGAAATPFDDHVYVLTPQARIVELQTGATPVDFAYALHTELGHRCRGARIDGALLPLNTVLRSGQTVEIIAAKQGGPSRDWLNPDLGFLHSARSRAKVRAWFNAQAQAQTQAAGRAAVEKLLQREGRTGLSLHELAAGLGLRSPEQLFERAGSDALPLRQIEQFLRGAPAEAEAPELRAGRAHQPGGVLVVGVDSLLTQLARCCKPAPPDPIIGFVTRGKGVSVHRAGCPNARNLQQQHGERVIAVSWGESGDEIYPVDIAVEATDRQGLLRDISEVFSKAKINVIGVHTQSRDELAHMLFTVELRGLDRLPTALDMLRDVPGVRRASRR